MSKNYLKVNQEARTADIYIYGDLTQDNWYEDTVSALSVADQIRDMDVDVIHVHIDSYGGEVSEGWAIYSQLIAHKAKIISYADGFVASAALYPFLAGDQRIASTLSGFFFHEVLSGAYGYAADLRKAADDAEKMTGIGISAFVERIGMEESTVRDLMAQETWVTPDEAMDYGLVTEIHKSAQASSPSQSAKTAIFARLKEKPEQKKDQKSENKPTGIMKMLAGL